MPSSALVTVELPPETRQVQVAGSPWETQDTGRQPRPAEFGQDAMTVSKYRSRARAETTKRLLAQSINEGTVPNSALAQAATRTVSVPGYTYDLKLSLARLTTSALRVLPCWSAAAAPAMTALLKKVVPPDLWLFGEVAAVTGSQEDTSEARYITYILRERIEVKAL
ncbi:hypothetical protein ACJZ2D_011555 [Fusarium nematophilum]